MDVEAICKFRQTYHLTIQLLLGIRDDLPIGLRHLKLFAVFPPINPNRNPSHPSTPTTTISIPVLPAPPQLGLFAKNLLIDLCHLPRQPLVALLKGRQLLKQLLNSGEACLQLQPLKDIPVLVHVLARPQGLEASGLRLGGFLGTACVLCEEEGVVLLGLVERDLLEFEGRAWVQQQHRVVGRGGVAVQCGFFAVEQ